MPTDTAAPDAPAESAPTTGERLLNEARAALAGGRPGAAARLADEAAAAGAAGAVPHWVAAVGLAADGNPRMAAVSAGRADAHAPGDARGELVRGCVAAFADDAPAARRHAAAALRIDPGCAAAHALLAGLAAVVADWEAVDRHAADGLAADSGHAACEVLAGLAGDSPSRDDGAACGAAVLAAFTPAGALAGVVAGSLDDESVTGWEALREMWDQFVADHLLPYAKRTWASWAVTACLVAGVGAAFATRSDEEIEMNLVETAVAAAASGGRGEGDLTDATEEFADEFAPEDLPAEDLADADLPEIELADAGEFEAPTLAPGVDGVLGTADDLLLGADGRVLGLAADLLGPDGRFAPPTTGTASARTSPTDGRAAAATFAPRRVVR